MMTMTGEDMVRYRLYSLVFAVLVGSPLAAGVLHKAHNPIPNAYVVIFKPDAVLNAHVATDDFATRFRLRTGWVYDKSFAGFAFTGSTAAAAAIADDPRVLLVSEDGTGTVTSTYQQNNPPGWGLDRIDQHYLPLDHIYHYDYTGHRQFASGVTIYILDSGMAANLAEFSTGGIIDSTHPTRVVAQQNFVLGNDYDRRLINGNCTPATAPRTASDAYDVVFCSGATVEPSHGTNVASIAAGYNYGVAKNASIVNYRVAANNHPPTVTSSNVVAAINSMINRHNSLGGGFDLAVANLSFTMGGLDTAVDYAVYSALYSGIEVVAAANDFGQNACNYSPSNAGRAAFYANNPYGYNGITVGASTSSDQVYSGTSYGPCVDFFAPGMGITSLNSDNVSVTTFEYSSAATPHVAGVAAIQMEESGLYPVPLENRMKSLATPNVLSYPGNASWFSTTSTPNLLLYSLSY